MTAKHNAGSLARFYAMGGGEPRTTAAAVLGAAINQRNELYAALHALVAQRDAGGVPTEAHWTAARDALKGYRPGGATK